MTVTHESLRVLCDPPGLHQRHNMSCALRGSMPYRAKTREAIRTRASCSVGWSACVWRSAFRERERAGVELKDMN